MAGVPTLRVRESFHLQKIRELRNIIAELLPQSVIMINNNTNISEENVENIVNDIEILTNMQKVIKEEKLLRRVRQKLSAIQRERNRCDRLNNLTVNVEAPPAYEEVIQHHQHMD